MPETSDFYDRLAPYYDAIFGDRSPKDERFYRNLAQDTDGKILELGCGTGRVLVPLARLGLKITGVDRSVSSLAICRDKLARDSVYGSDNVRLVCSDIADIALRDSFSLALMPFNTFLHLYESTTRERCLRSLHPC